MEFQREGRLREAIAQYDEAIRLNPQTTHDAYFNHGNAYVTLDKPDRIAAIRDYSEAIRLSPQYTNAYVNRGNVYLDLGQPQRAIVDYDAAIKLDAAALVSTTGALRS